MQYNVFVAKKCNIKIDKHKEIWPETSEQYECNSKQRKGKLFQEILDLEDKTSTRACGDKYCQKEDVMDTECMDLGEVKCREKYKDVIENMRKTKKRNISSLQDCLD